MIKRILIACLMILTGGTSGWAQGVSQAVRGTITGPNGTQPIEGATIVILDSVNNLTAQSDADGVFNFDAVPAGLRTLKVEQAGYREYTLPGLEIEGSRELILAIRLEPNIALADSVVITAQNQRLLSGVSTRTISLAETKRYAATFYDPARLATSFAGVATGNDGANHLVIRGNSPNGLLWRLEGVDIVNPNHLPNAGTFSDLPSLRGGGVTILSTQLMSDVTFSQGAFQANYGNALSGVMDVSLRSGNPTKDQYTVSASLIGLDLAAEGPVGKTGNSSFVGNYRYSTVGVLSALGVDVGDEDINYQDLSFKFNFPTKKAGTFSFFGMGGTSKNDFEAIRDTSVWGEEKDRSDITFSSRMGALGLTHQVVLGTKTFVRSALAASGISNERNQDFVLSDSAFSTPTVEEDRQQQSLITFNTSISHQFSDRLSAKGGVFVNRIGYDLLSRRADLEDPFNLNTVAEAEGNTFLLQPYAQANYRVNERLRVRAGVHVMQLSLNNDISIEPRAGASYLLFPGHTVSLAYGLHSQMQPLNLYFTPSDSLGNSPNRDLGFTRAHHVVVSYAAKLNDHFSIKVEPYFQSLFNVPIVNRPSSSFSALNLFEGAIADSLSNDGTGTNMGVDVNVERSLSKGYYYMLGVSVYDSKYTGGDGIERDTRFNGNYLFTATGGKEFYFNRPNKQVTWGLNARVVYQGGYRTTPIDTLASAATGATVLRESEAFSEQLADYFRLDIRISWKKNKKGYTRTLAFDLQNATNRENVASQRYDIQAQRIITRFQLGLIPLLTYRLDF
ncbi:MAG: TonB-dependent receptor [Bacteroidota bacterium]